MIKASYYLSIFIEKKNQNNKAIYYVIEVFKKYYYFDEYLKLKLACFIQNYLLEIYYYYYS